jgi:hypothetical protein
MSARRRDSRMDFVNTDGVLRVLRDVIVRRIERDQFIAVSSEAGIKGEILTIYFATDGNKPVPVRVIDSHPTIVEGFVRHQLRLTCLDREVFPHVATTPGGCSEAE